MTQSENTPLTTRCEISLPEWAPGFVSSWQGDLDSIEGRMDLAIALSRQNVSSSHGGPFGAVVFDLDERRVLGVGVNMVTRLHLSCAHAEMVAVSLAQHAIGSWNLSAGRSVELSTSCEPCAMCFGAVPWSGVRRLVCAARKEDAEAAGFDEGDKPEDWRRSLAARGIEVICDVLRDEAAEVFRLYQEGSGEIYNP